MHDRILLHEFRRRRELRTWRDTRGVEWKTPGVLVVEIAVDVEHDRWVGSWSRPEVGRLNAEAATTVLVDGGIFMGEQAFHEMHTALFEGGTGVERVCRVESDEIQNAGCERARKRDDAVN